MSKKSLENNHLVTWSLCMKLLVQTIAASVLHLPLYFSDSFVSGTRRLVADSSTHQLAPHASQLPGHGSKKLTTCRQDPILGSSMGHGHLPPRGGRQVARRRQEGLCRPEQGAWEGKS